jgi:hypothetical protein
VAVNAGAAALITLAAIRLEPTEITCDTARTVESSNLFRPPQSQLGAAPPAEEEGESIPHAIVSDVVACRGWMRFFAAIGLLKSLGIVAAAFLMPNLPSSIQLGMLIFAAIIDILVVILIRTSGRISAVERVPTAKRLDDMLAELAHFWRLAGIFFGFGAGLFFFCLFFLQQFIGSVQ